MALLGGILPALFSNFISVAITSVVSTYAIGITAYPLLLLRVRER
jgi:hypothetical protein